MRLLLLLLACLPCTASASREDTLTHEREDTLPTLVVKGSARTPVVSAIGKSLKAHEQPRTRTLGDIINKRFPYFTDCIMHPFAIKARKRERRRKRLERILRDYDLVKTPNELLLEAIQRQREEEQKRLSASPTP